MESLCEARLKAREQNGPRNLALEAEEMKLSNAETGVIEEYWFWAAASAAQLGWGVAALKKGYSGHTNLMPLKAFAVASLLVGAASSAAVATLRLSGIHTVEDLKTLGANIRSACKNTR